jgi:hypothetical protein
MDSSTPIQAPMSLLDPAGGSAQGHYFTEDGPGERRVVRCETGRVTDQLDELAQIWEWFAVGQCRGYSPIYERIASSVARDRELLELVRRTPPECHLPLSLLAAVHDLLLDGIEHPLAEVYAGTSDADPAPLFADVCRRHPDAVTEVMAARPVQTNECGRSALIGPALTWLASQGLGPLALVDVGASAGLNLLCDRYRLDYGSYGATGPPDSPVTVQCRVEAGDPPIAQALPELVARVGIDRSTVDLSEAGDVRWLLACVWPDTGRLDRTRAAVELARSDPPTVREGDANELLPKVLDELPSDAVPVVCTTWSFSYFSLEQRAVFEGLLSDASRRGPVAWLCGDGADVLASLAGRAGAPRTPSTDQLLGVELFTEGDRESILLARVQPHGSWLEWCAP